MKEESLKSSKMSINLGINPASSAIIIENIVPLSGKKERKVLKIKKS